MAEQTDAKQPKDIHVKVTFPLTKGGPYEADDPGETTASAVRAAAMEHFKVTNDAQFTYHLTHDGATVEETATLTSIAGKAHSVSFRLVKEITQG